MVFYLKGKNELGGEGWVSSASFHGLQTRAHKQGRAHFNEVDIFTAGG